MNINKEYMGCFGKAKHSLSPTAIVIHHTCTESPRRTRKILASKGYSTHFEVDTDGMVYQYRDIYEQCSHCGSANCHCIGIDVTHMAGRVFPNVQVRAVKALVQYLCRITGIPEEVHEQLSGIYPHRALGSTACPDNFPMEELC